MEWFAILRYVVVLAVFTAVGAPLAAWVFRALPGRGAAFALPAALVPTTLLTIWIGQLAFGLWTLVLALGLTALAAAVAYRQGARPDWGAVWRAFGVFLLGFGFLVAVRASDPAVTPQGGEQFLHYALTRSIERATVLPPEDVWFAGEPLRYYFGGQLQVTGLSMLSGVELPVGFNLGIATFYGLLVVAAYGLAGAITERAGYDRRLGGLLGVVFVAWGGSTTPAIRLLIGQLPRDLALRIGRPAFAAIRHMDYETAVVEQGNPTTWGWFFTRYVVPETLQEFPLYSFVKADLHGHALSTGYVLLAAALAYAYYLTPAEQHWRRRAILFGALGTMAGMFGVMNTWSLPTALGLAWLAVAAAPAAPSSLYPAVLADRLEAVAPSGNGLTARVAHEAWRVVLAVPAAVGVGLVGVVLAAPFLLFGHVPQNEGIGLFPPRSPLVSFLVIYVGLVLLASGFVLWRGAPAFRGECGRRNVAILAVVLLGAVPLLAVIPVLAILGPILLGCWWLVRTDRAGFAPVLVVAGFGLLVAMELVYADVWPPELDRWNTTLKVAIQAWTLAAAGLGAAAAILVGAARGRLREAAARPDGGPGWRPRAGGIAAIALVVLVVLASLPFPLLVTASTVGDGIREGDDFALGAIEPLEPWHGEELEAIRWLDDRQGRPVIVERPGWDLYAWTNPASTLTGLPTVAGWAHQRGYRGVAAYEARAAQADSVYEGSWANATAVLREHDVRYLYVGPNEREAYDGLGARFGTRRGLSVAYENDAVVIYRVDHETLAD